MRFGAIDVGTNSIHLIVVDVDAAFDTTNVVYKAREMVRLGSNDAMERGRLSEKAMSRATEALAKFVEAAFENGADTVRAVATSAVREAANGSEFAEIVRARTGIELEILSDREEARLIHLGVASGFPMNDRIACIIDIGGGSTEFIVGDSDRPYLLESVKLGSLRLYDRYLRDRTNIDRAARDLRLHIASELEPVLERVRRYQIDLMIGTSGTIMGVAAVDAAGRGTPVKRTHGYVLERERIETLQTAMLGMTEQERRRLPGMNPRRADIIVAGNAILIAALDALGASSIVVCERALRDGIIVDLAARDRAIADRISAERRMRIEAVEHLAAKYDRFGAHQRNVARLALQLFGRLAELHGLPPSDRDILFAASIVHAIGGFVGETERHKHNAYLIRHSLLPGWRNDEIETIALVSRYYRKSMPKLSHADFAALSIADRRRVEVLASLLRIADGLDDRALGLVTDVTVRRENGRIVLVAQAEGDVTDELDAAMLKADLFERTFATKVSFE